ncbi:MAG TPA: cupredoxin family copper-binding protein [Candidatus Nanoarchaeia archaeon]|nr:cupredoxin family copper-binding protein [Candidatus Nanoarchaeia archaeon]
MRTVLITILIVAMLSSCGWEAPQQPAPSADSGLPVVTVTIKDFKFIPETVTLKEGQTVTWVNEDAPIHTATATNKAFDTKELYQGDSGSWTADKQGAFEYVCALHPNMKGKIIVE